MGSVLPLAAGLVLVADWLSKAVVARHLAVGRSIRLGSWLRIRHVAVARRGRRPRSRLAALLLLWGAALGVIILVIRRGDLFQPPAAQAGLGAAVGGAASNLFDRLRHAAVIDFLDVGRWPVLNIADVAITLERFTFDRSGIRTSGTSRGYRDL